MKVLIVNTFDSGGAAQACIRLHLALLAENIESKLLLLESTREGISASYKFQKPAPVIPGLLQRGLRKVLRFVNLGKASEKTKKNNQQKIYRSGRALGLEGVSFIDTGFDITKSTHYHEADVINLHWVAGFLDWQTFFKNNNKPVIWTLHDQNPFLGANHYEEKYYGILNDGMPRKRIVNEEEISMEKSLILEKENLISNTLISPVIVTPSVWLKNSSLQNHAFRKLTHRIIPNGLDILQFKVLDKAFSKICLNLPVNKKIVLFVADDITSNRKGYHYLERSLKLVDAEHDILSLAAGSNEGKVSTDKVIYLGKIFDPLLLCLVYNAADLFVIPSLEDNLPNTVLESLCCGTPVVGFQIGGLVDMIEGGVNGFLSAELSVEGLSVTISKGLNFKFNQMKISQLAMAKYDSRIQASRYIDLYKNVLKQSEQ